MPRARKHKNKPAKQTQNTKVAEEPGKNQADFSNIHTTGKARVYYNKKWYEIPLKDIEDLINMSGIGSALGLAIVHATNLLGGIFGKKVFTDEDFELFEAEKFAAGKYRSYFVRKKPSLSCRSYSSSKTSSSSRSSYDDEEEDEERCRRMEDMCAVAYGMGVIDRQTWSGPLRYVPPDKY